MRLAIRRPQNDEEWDGWQDIPDSDILGRIEYRLYDDLASAVEIEVYVWEDGDPPEPVRDALNSGVLELRP